MAAYAYNARSAVIPYAPLDNRHSTGFCAAGFWGKLLEGKLFPVSELLKSAWDFVFDIYH